MPTYYNLIIVLSKKNRIILSQHTNYYTNTQMIGPLHSWNQPPPLKEASANYALKFWHVIWYSTISFHCLACLNCDYVNGEIMLAGFHMIIFFHTICPTSMAGCPIYLESPLYKISSLFSHFCSFQMLFYKKCLSLFFSECSFYCLGRFFASW